MTHLNIWYANLGGTASVKILSRENTGHFSGELAKRDLADTGGVADISKADKSITGAGAVIDNQHNSYWVQYCVESGLNTLLYGVRITYTYKTAGD